MTAKELDNTISYIGQLRAMRQLCIERKLIPIEQLALMTTREVCEVIANHFEILGIRNGGQTILLVEKDKWNEIMKSVVMLCR